MTRIGFIVGAGLIGVAAVAAVGPALAQGAAPSATAPKPDPAYDAAKAAFEALPELERKAVQDALVWSGDYNAAAAGTFGRRTYDAIAAYQRRAKLGPNGILDQNARADLVAAGKRARDAAKFVVAVDPKTGVEIGVPGAIFVKRDANPNGGTRWQSADGRITLDTRAIPATETDLNALYERTVAVQGPGRQVTYKLLRPDFFVVSGETATGKFYTRYAAGPGGLRGFSLGYDKAVAKDFDRTLIAIANSFAAFPSAQPAAASPAPAPPARPAVIASAAPLATGVVVAPGRVLTSAAVESCTNLRVAKGPGRLLKSDKAAGLALVQADGAPRAASLAIAPAALQDEDAMVLSFAVTGGEQALVATPASLRGSRLVAPLQPGAAGAPAFDRSGALLGLAGALAARPRMIAGIVPPLSHPAVPATTVATFLADNGVALPNASAGPPRSAGDLAAALGPAVVAIDCGP
jgi:peptidoglycan hydrolase-like protein with peptidoglycan-binding domain